MSEQRPAPVTAADLAARIAALEAENAQLRAAATARAAADVATGPAAPAPPAAAPGRTRHPGRATAAVVLIVLGALLAPVAVVAVWARDLVTDTDRYVATVGPLVDDPQIQSAVTERVTGAIVQAADLPGLAAEAATAVDGLGLPPRVAALAGSLQEPLVDAATGFIRRAVEAVVTSDVLEAVWDEANRTVHDQLGAVLRGDPDAVASIDAQGQLVVDLTGVVDTVRASLSDAGFTLIDRLPTISVSFPLMQSEDLVRAQNAYRLLDVLGTWLVWLSLGLLAAGVLAAVHRSRALVVAGLSLAGAMLLLGAALTIGRSLYVNALPPEVQRPDAAVVVYDQVVAFLRVALRSAFVLGVVVALVAFLAGGTSAARALRASWSRGAASLRTAGERRGVSTGPVGVWLDEQRVLVRVVVAAGSALTLVLAEHLTPRYVLTVALVAVVLLAVTTLAARPAEARAEPGDGKPASPVAG
ncbi:hypothetical protein [Cellulomonas pakistanensis]|uniref:Integral membrane protein n=1 Tax=Cellulomonas pakistanensis TaxID=992287 RepID=A0A919U5C3_9CELL|nr:hypothetical protein [Cellulomonas pakistanensis]GIG35140.1 hypothetical protein Cpa01nite_05210 [Cellulomonas pakistanensis]